MELRNWNNHWWLILNDNDNGRKALVNFEAVNCIFTNDKGRTEIRLNYGKGLTVNESVTSILEELSK